MSGGFTPKLVALDIDGTLVDAESRMPATVKRAVGAVAEAGVPVVLSTGRSWWATQIVFDELQLPPGWAVASNGSKVITYPPVEVHVDHLFDPQDVIRQVAGLAPEALIAVEEGMSWRVSRPFPEGELHGDVVVESIEELASRPVSRVVIRDPNSSEEKFQQLTDRLNLHEVAYFIGWSAWLDIAPQGIDKAHGLQRVVDELGLSASDVLAIGDGRNDIEMLQWAGRGVAMGNAPDDVRAAADAVTGHFVDDGVVAELRRWF